MKPWHGILVVAAVVVCAVILVRPGKGGRAPAEGIAAGARSSASDSPLYSSRLSASLKRFEDSRVGVEDVTAPAKAVAPRPTAVRPTPPGPRPPTAEPAADGAIVQGRLAFEEKRWEEALAFFDRAIADNDTDYLAHSYRADALFRLHRFDEAIAAYARSRAINPSFVFPLYGIAACQYAKGDLEDALETYREVLRLRPADKTARSQIAAIEKRLAIVQDEPEDAPQESP